MSFAIDPAGDALVVVDVQNDFCPGGSLAVPDGDQVVAVLNQYARRFQVAGAPIFASRDWHPRETRHFRSGGGLWPPHCVQGTRGVLFHPDLALPKETVILSKGMDPAEDAYSCFQARDPDGTEFSVTLEKRGVHRLFLGGLATDYCVRATVLDALREGFRVVLLRDAIRAVNLAPGDGDRALAGMKAAGAAFAMLADF